MNVTHTLKEDQYLVTHSVGPNQHGIRLDAFLKERYHRRSRAQIQKAIENGHVHLQRNHGTHLMAGRLKPSYTLVPGDEVLVVSDKKPEPPVNFDYKIIFEDETLFVIDKPSNLPVHPAGIYFFHTLLVHLRTEGLRNPLKAEREYFLVHRIDKETSGILVLTKDKDVATHLTRQFAERTTAKRYLAIVKGVPPEEFECDQAIKRSTGSKIELKMMLAPESEGGQSAFTRFKRLEVHGEYSLVECFPKTGRQHQIRIHLEHCGHPIVGDKLYGIPESEALRFFERQNLSAEAQAKILLPRHALHAAGIEFEHPVTGKQMKFSCELPADLRDFLNRQHSAHRPAPRASSAHPSPA